MSYLTKGLRHALDYRSGVYELRGDSPERIIDESARYAPMILVAQRLLVVVFRLRWSHYFHTLLVHSLDTSEPTFAIKLHYHF